MNSRIQLAVLFNVSAIILAIGLGTPAWGAASCFGMPQSVNKCMDPYGSELSLLKSCYSCSQIVSKNKFCYPLLDTKWFSCTMKSSSSGSSRSSKSSSKKYSGSSYSSGSGSGEQPKTSGSTGNKVDVDAANTKQNSGDDSGTGESNVVSGHDTSGRTSSTDNSLPPDTTGGNDVSLGRLSDQMGALSGGSGENMKLHTDTTNKDPALKTMQDRVFSPQPSSPSEAIYGKLNMSTGNANNPSPSTGDSGNQNLAKTFGVETPIIPDNSEALKLNLGTNDQPNGNPLKAKDNTTGSSDSDSNNNIKSGMTLSEVKAAQEKQEGNSSGSGDGNGSNGSSGSNRKPTNDDECKLSVNINKEYTCSATHMLVDGAQVANMAGQALGSAVVSGAGQLQIQKNLSDPSQANAVKSAASLQSMAGAAELTTGAMNLGLGIAQFAAMQQQKKDQKAIGKNVTQAQVEDSFRVNTCTSGNCTYDYKGKGDEYNALKAAMGNGAPDHKYTQQSAQTASNRVRDYGDEAEKEKAAIISKARGGAFMSTMQGVGQMMKGTFDMIAAAKMRDAANKLAEETGPAIALPTMPTYNGDAMGARTPTTVTGAGDTTAAASEVEAGQEAAPSPLPPLPGEGLADKGPEADPFKSEKAGNGNGGGGPGFGGVSGTAPSSGSEEPAAKSATMTSQNGYEGAGGGGNYGAVGGGKGGGGGDGTGIDLSALAGLLKKDDEKNGVTNGILDYGNRSPSSLPSGILGPNSKSLFSRISDSTSDNFRRGNLR